MIGRAPLGPGFHVSPRQIVPKRGAGEGIHSCLTCFCSSVQLKLVILHALFNDMDQDIAEARGHHFEFVRVNFGRGADVAEPHF